MRFSYSGIWDDTVRLLKAHGSLLAAVAGVFVLLPGLLSAYFLPWPGAASAAQLMALMQDYFRQHWPWLLLANLVSTMGSITMLLLLFDRGQLTVGGAIKAAVPLLVPYFVATALGYLAIGCGLLLFVLPGLYLLGRIVPLGPVIVAEHRLNPAQAYRRTFALTRRRGVEILGLVLAVLVAGYLVMFAVSRVLGSIFLLLAGRHVGALLALILDAGLAAVLTTVTLVLYAAIYRRLVATP